MTTEEKPLFKPGQSLMSQGATFICNINDELSLWRAADTLRVYVADSIGVWLDNEERLKRQVDMAAKERLRITTPEAFRTATIIARNADAVAVYMDMLGSKLSTHIDLECYIV